MNNKPNVILINCDDMGYGDLGCYGSKVNDTPTIDNLANEGMVFTDFYAASSLCSPSRGSLMTGCYPPRISFGSFEGNGVLFPGQGVGLNKNEYTLGNLFKSHNYATKIVGKWHCGDQKEFLPTRFGFDEFYGLPYSNDMGMQANTTNRKVRKHPPLPLIKNEDVIQQQPDQRGITERYVEQSLDFINKNKDKNFFLYLAHMHVHLPLYASEVFLKNSRNGDFGACMSSIDWSTNCIINELKKLEILDNTIIIFTSDNGSRNDNGASNGKLRNRKGTTWEGGQRVPLIVYWKDKIKSAKVCNQITSNIDLLPTFAAILGDELPKDNLIDGKDISKCFADNNVKLDDVFYYYLQERLEAVRKGNWKLHFYKEGKPVKYLYNLKTDISEQDNVYDENLNIVKELTQLADKKRTQIGDSLLNIKGEQVREKGRVKNPVPLTIYDESHPYIVSMYDKEERG